MSRYRESELQKAIVYVNSQIVHYLLASIIPILPTLIHFYSKIILTDKGLEVTRGHTLLYLNGSIDYVGFHSYL